MNDKTKRRIIWLALVIVTILIAAVLVLILFHGLFSD
ncbi:amiloride-sensitive sodium channel family protein [bacterium]|nr:amiloride-sensitive sodium channel family protein [bacterium]